MILRSNSYSERKFAWSEFYIVRIFILGIRYVVLEKAESVGGTWWYNNYPGAAVDIKSHTYCYSFFPKHSWKDAYSFRDEILQYIYDVVNHFGLKENIRLKV